MRVRPGDAARAAAAVAVLAVLSWAAWVVIAPPPRLDKEAVAALASSGRFQEGEAQVAAYLRSRPDDPSALLLAAQMALDRPEPTENDAERAESYLKRIRHVSRRMSANVEYDRGKAAFYRSRMDQAEKSWRQALDIDPSVPEAAWGLLAIYYVEGRGREARALALRQHVIEPDPRDRVLYLLELVRADCQKIAPAGVVRWTEPVVRKNPDDLRARLAHDRGLVLGMKVDEGLDDLRAVLAAHPDDPDVWDALLNAVADGGASAEELIASVGRLPRPLVADPRFAKHLGRAAREKLDWMGAIAQYRRAIAADPGDTTTRYRLARALRSAHKLAEADRLDRELQDVRAANNEMVLLYEKVQGDKRLGAVPDPELYRRFADLRERLGHRDEAAAWYRLALQAKPDDAFSSAAVKRLDAP